MKKSLITALAVGVAFVGLALWVKYGGVGAETVWRASEGGSWLLPLVVLTALVDSVNPCAFSILLVTIAFLFSLGKLRSNILGLGLVYILGIFLTYLTIGLGLLQALHLFDTPHFMGILGAALLILLGTINILGEVFPNFPITLAIPKSAHDTMARLMRYASFPTVFALGVLVGLCEFPCTGGPYLMVLGLLHDTGTYLSGFGYLLLYNLIFVAPLILILLIAGNEGVVDTLRTWQRENRRTMRLVGGVLMIAIGAAILIL